MRIPDPAQQLLTPATNALEQINNPILIILIVFLCIAILAMGWVIYKLYISLNKTIIKKEDGFKLELKDKEEQVEEAYKTIHSESKTNLEFMLAFESKFTDHIKQDELLSADVKDILVIVNTLKTQFEFLLNK